jgi:hypothetical protein
MLKSNSERLRLLAACLVACGCGRVGYAELPQGASPPRDEPRGGSGGNGASVGDSGAPASTGGVAGMAPVEGGTRDAYAADTAPSGAGGSGSMTDSGVAGGGGVAGASSVIDSGISDAGAACFGVSRGGHAYAFCSTSRTWADAESDCVARGMLLARIDDSGENQFVYDTAFQGYSGKNVPLIWRWLGATDLGTSSNWRWADGTQFWSGNQGGSSIGGLYYHWLSSAPTDSSGTACALLQYASGQWKDASCVSLQPYVCEAY